MTARYYAVNLAYTNPGDDFSAAMRVSGGNALRAGAILTNLLGIAGDRVDRFKSLLNTCGNAVQVDTHDGMILVLGPPELLDPYTNNGPEPLLSLDVGEFIPVSESLAAVERIKALPSTDVVAKDMGDGLLKVIAPISTTLMYELSGRLSPADHFLMNPRDYTDLLRFGREYLTICSRKEWVRKGLQCWLAGANVLTSKDIEAGCVWACTRKYAQGDQTCTLEDLALMIVRRR